MPSFDIVNKINMEAFKNAINAVNRETSTDMTSKEATQKLKKKKIAILSSLTLI